MSQLGLVPSRPMLPVQNGTSSGTAALPSSALAIPAPSIVGHGDHLVGGMQRALPDEHRDPLAAVEDLGGLLRAGLATGTRRPGQ